MRNFGVIESNIVIEKQSGKDFNRPVYKKMVSKLKPGDVLVLKSIDRLGRSYEDILEQWRYITKSKGASITVIDMPLLDTRQSRNDLTGVFVADLVLQILSYVAQTEREFIKQRQAEGIAAAKLKGVQFGRPPKKRPDGFNEVFELWKEKKISARAAAARLGIDHNTFTSWAKQS